MKDLQKTKSGQFFLTEICKPDDLLKCKTIQYQVRTYGEQPVLGKIRMALEKSFIALDVPVDDVKMRILCEDLMDTYTHDSIEDIYQALKKGRSGQYGTNYNKLNMVVIAEWMSRHLEEKAIARERKVALLKAKNFDNQSEHIDYEAYRQRVNQPQKKRTNESENAYQRFRLNYLNKKNNTENEQLKQKDDDARD